MGLIHCQQRNVRKTRKIQKRFCQKPLRSHIDQLILSSFCQLQRLQILIHRQRTVQICRMDPHLVQRGHLILHQRDQRRHHQRDPRKQKRRHLITHRLARPRRHNAKHISALQHSLDQLLLSRAKRIITIQLTQNLFFCHAILSFSSLSRRYFPIVPHPPTKKKA